MTILYRSLILSLVCIFAVRYANAQNTVVTPASPVNLCVGGSYVTLDTIYIAETDVTNFNVGIGLTYFVSVPANFQFNPAVTPTVIAGAGGNVSIIPVSPPTSTTFSFSYNVTPPIIAPPLDSIMIIGLQVRAITTPSTGNILRSSGPGGGIQAGNAVANTQNHCSLTSVTGVPAITTQPVNSSFCAGTINAPTFSIVATGSGLSYSWERDDNNASNGAGFDAIDTAVGLSANYLGWTSSDLIDKSILATQNGYLYRCIVSNGCGSVTSTNGVLTAADPALITLQPTNQKFCPSSNKTFTVTAGGITPSYQWQQSTGGAFTNITNGGVYSGATTGTLTLTGVTAPMSGHSYRCVTDNPVCVADTSNIATLTLDMPVITTQPTNQFACVGNAAGFTVTGNSVSAYQWQRNKNDEGGVGFEDAPSSFYGGATTSNITISSGNMGTNLNGYSFRCILSSCSGTLKDTTNITTLTVFNSGGLGFNLQTQYCRNASVDTLIGSPVGGTFSGPGIGPTNPSTGKAVFNPLTAGTAGIKTVTYSLGCSLGKNTTVRDTAEIIFTSPANANPIYANTPTPEDLQVQLTSGGGALSGTFSGAGVTGTQFHPDLAGVGTHPVMFTYVNANGCTSRVVKNFTVTNPGIGIPKLLASSPYCQNSGVSILLNDTTVHSGYTNDSGVKTLFGSGPKMEDLPYIIENYPGYYSFYGYEGPGISYVGGKTWMFTPTVAGSYAINYKYKYSYTYPFPPFYTYEYVYTWATQTIIVNAQTPLSISGITQNVCNTAAAFNLTPSPGVITGGAGTGVSIVAPVSAPAGILTGSPANPTFNPSVAGQGAFKVRYHYLNNDNCASDVDSIITIIGKPAKPVMTLDDTAFCKSEPSFNILTNIVNPATDGFSDINFPTSGSGISARSFVPGNADPGKHTIRYTYTNQYGCENHSDTIISVYALPIPDINVTNFCASKPTFFDGTGSDVPPEDAVSNINSYAWDFGNANSSTDVSSSSSPSYIYPETSDPLNQDKQSFLVKLTVGTDKGCFKADTTTIVVGNIPNTDFKWKDICPSDAATSFTDISGFTTSEVANYFWGFDDGSTINNNLKNPAHKMAGGTGLYNVKFKITSIRACADSIVHKVNILDQYRPTPSDPYIKTFQGGDGYWAVDGQNPSWEWGPTNKSHITTGSRKVWVTDTNGTYNADEKSYLNGPCINFQDLQKPMIAMKIWSATDSNSLAGTVFQYSKDGGTTWIRAGVQGDGINWYNSSGILGAPGGQLYGWTGVDLSGWKVAKIGLTSLAGNSSVRIRLAFAGINLALRDGFALDSVWVGERDKVSLIENFTNASSSAVAIPDANLNALVNSRANDVKAIHYHTGFPGSDPINLRNQSGPSSRVLYYGVPSVPYTVFEGNYNYGTVLDTNDIDRRSLEHAKFVINLNTVISSNSVNVKAKIIAREAVSNDIVIYAAVVERNITAIPGNFQWAMTRMLPDPSGTFVNQNFAIDDSSKIDLTWNFSPSEVYDPTQLGVVVFVQDVVTKEVYQTVYFLGTGSVNGLRNEMLAGKEFFVYPNPADNVVKILLEEASRDDYNYSVHDELGKVVAEGIIGQGSNEVTLHTSELASGLYVIKIGNYTDGFAYKKLLIIH